MLALPAFSFWFFRRRKVKKLTTAYCADGRCILYFSFFAASTRLSLSLSLSNTLHHPPLPTRAGADNTRYSSFKAIESKDDTKDDTQWLTYWVVYSVFLIGESLADYSVFWLPGYRFLKCGFVFWLASPRFKGAQVLYNDVIAQGFRSVEPVVDNITSQLAKGDFSSLKKELAPATEALTKFGNEAFEKTMTIAAEAAKKAQEGADAAKKD